MSKHVLKSKTIWVNSLVGILSFLPGVGEWIGGNPATFAVVTSILNLGLRALTGEAVSWKIIDKKL